MKSPLGYTRYLKWQKKWLSARKIIFFSEPLVKVFSVCPTTYKGQSNREYWKRLYIFHNDASSGANILLKSTFHCSFFFFFHLYFLFFNFLGPRNASISHCCSPWGFYVCIWWVYRHERCNQRTLAVRAWWVGFHCFFSTDHSFREFTKHAKRFGGLSRLIIQQKNSNHGWVLLTQWCCDCSDSIFLRKGRFSFFLFFLMRFSAP